jgi:hypothetical protein
MGMSAGHTFNPSTREAEAGGSLCVAVESVLLINTGGQDRGKGSWLGVKLPAF